MHDTTILLDLNETPEAAAVAVAHALALPMQLVRGGVGIAWYHADKERRVTFSQNDLVDDGDVRMGAYRFDLTIEASDDEARHAIARRWFDVLKVLRAPMLLVDNVQVKLDEWAPPVPPASTGPQIG